MEAFFEKKDYIILKVAAFVYDSTETTFTLSEVSRSLNIDKRSLINSITEYNYLHYEDSGLQLTINHDELISYYTPWASLKLTTQFIFKQTLLYVLCDDLFQGNFINLVQFSEIHYISLSSMYRRVNRLKKILAQYHVSLDLHDQTFFKGKEKQIRHFFYELYISAYGLEEPPFLQKLAQQRAEEYHQKNFLASLPFPIQQKIKLITNISIYRIKNNCLHLQGPFNFETYDIQIDSTDLMNHLEQQLTLFISDPSALVRELDFLLIYILTNDVIAIDKFKFIDIQNIDFNNRWLQLARNWIPEMASYFNIVLPANEYFFLLINLYYYYVRNDFLNNASRYNFDSRRKKSVLEADNRLIFKRTIAFLTQATVQNSTFETKGMSYFYYLLIREVFYSSDLKVNLSVYSTLAHAQKDYIEEQLQHAVPFPLEFNQTGDGQIDLIISDFIYPKTQTKQTRHIIVETFPTSKNYTFIIKELFKIYSHKKESSFE